MTIYSPHASPAATRAVLERWGLHSKKALGQHFLISDNVVGRILRLAQISAGETVLEVGPGIGTLTEAILLANAGVFAVEKDQALLPVLQDIQLRYPERFCFLHADALELLNGKDCSKGARTNYAACNKLVANLPYAVAATIVLLAFENLANLQSATIMVQREVAARMMATPASKDYGAYTVKLQALAVPREYFFVAPGNFMPPPRVDSTVLRLERRCAEELAGLSIQALFTIANAAFYQRRKTIRNSMSAYFSANQEMLFLPQVSPQRIPQFVESLLEQAKIEPTSRGEEHDGATYRRLSQAFTDRLPRCL